MIQGPRTTLPSRFYKTKHPGVLYRLGEKGDRRYYIDYYDSMGNRCRVRVQGKLEDARRERASILERMGKGEKVLRSSLTVNDLIEDYLKTQTAHLKESTRTVYEQSLDRYVKPRLGRKKVSELTTADVAGFINDMRSPTKQNPKGYKRWTIQSCLVPMGNMFFYAVDQGWMSKNPITDLRRQARPKNDQAKMEILSTEEINRLLKVKTEYNLLFTVATFTGLRKGELLNLTWEDCDLLGQKVNVREGKTRAAVRQVTIPDWLVEKLAREMKTEGIMFPFSPSNVNRALTAALKQAKVKHVRFHDLRHTYASIIIQEGNSLTKVAKQMGHANPSITLKVYAQLFDAGDQEEKLKKSLERFAEVVG